MDSAQIQVRVRELMAKYVRRDFSNVDDVFTQGFVNSLEAVELTLQLEREFGIKIRDAEVKNLRTVESISRFIEQRQG